MQVTFTRDLWEKERLSIPFRAERNVNVLELRPAHTWMPGRSDVRRRSLFLTAMLLEETRVP